jgi:hypothetical protein
MAGDTARMIWFEELRRPDIGLFDGDDSISVTPDSFIAVKHTVAAAKAAVAMAR